MERKQHFKAMLPRAMQGHHRPAPLGSALEREPGGGAFSQVSCVCVCVLAPRSCPCSPAAMAACYISQGSSAMQRFLARAGSPSWVRSQRQRQVG